MGSLYLFLHNITPAMTEAARQMRTNEALAEARNALIGYALKYRDQQVAKKPTFDEPDDKTMYGYFPLPDLGGDRNSNFDGNCLSIPGDQSSHRLEGCDANVFDEMTFNTDTGIGPTVVGRFPWRTLGTGPLRDGNGECLWMLVSASHSRTQRPSPDPTPPPMNWDTLTNLEVVAAIDETTLRSELKTKHERPIAVIFSPGAVLGNTGRAKSLTDTSDTTECGGNYDAQFYLETLQAMLDPTKPTELVASNIFSGSTNNASSSPTDPTDPPLKPISLSGIISKKNSNNKLTKGRCNDCTIVANDVGVQITPDQFYSQLRGGKAFRQEINSMLDRMVSCMRDKGITPSAISGQANPADKTIGRVPTDTCYDDDKNPLGYFSNYQSQFFLAKPTSGNLTLKHPVLPTTAPIPDESCTAVLIFAGQRGMKDPSPTAAIESLVQLRTDDPVSSTNPVINTNWLANYIEGTNLASFTSTGLTFSGPATFGPISAKKSETRDVGRCTATNSVQWASAEMGCQTAEMDIVRCIPVTESLAPVTTPILTAAQQLVNYQASTQTLTLGKAGATNSIVGSTLPFGCAWQPEVQALGDGLRTYFQFSFAVLGNTGFVFALIDNDSNGGANFTSPCGMAGNHLGYSGNNGVGTPPVLPIRAPKIGIEFDQSRNTGFKTDGRAETATNKGRNDPCYTCASGTYDSHAAIVYWGQEQANAADGVTLPDNDDNVHGYPSGSLSGVRKPPTNPASAPGINPVNLRTAGQLFHVRIEITPTRMAASPSENSSTTVQTKVWILADGPSVNQIAAMRNTTRPMSQLYASFAESLSDTASVFDVAGSACTAGACASGQTCGSDNVCYRPGLKNVRLGFTNSQRTQAQQVTISNIFTTWLH